VLGRVARFFVAKYPKMLKNIPNNTKLPNSHEACPMSSKYTNIFHSKALKMNPHWGGEGFGMKTYHLATLVLGT
jgi:hypothetical protein